MLYGKKDKVSLTTVSRKEKPDGTYQVLTVFKLINLIAIRVASIADE